MKRVIAYVDGFNLYFGMRSLYGRKYLWLDLNKMIQHYMGSDQCLVDVKYFTSKVVSTSRDPFKPDRQLSYLQALESTNIKLHYGEYVPDTIICSNCKGEIGDCPFYGKSIEKFNEKKTDVNISSEMIVDAFKDKYDIALLVSGDRDVSTPIEKVRRLSHSKKVFNYSRPTEKPFTLPAFAISLMKFAKLH